MLGRSDEVLGILVKDVGGVLRWLFGGGTALGGGCAVAVVGGGADSVHDGGGCGFVPFGVTSGGAAFCRRLGWGRYVLLLLESGDDFLCFC